MNGRRTAATDCARAFRGLLAAHRFGGYPRSARMPRGNNHMAEPNLADLKEALLAALPADGSAIGNIRLRRQLAAALGTDISETRYEQARDELVEAGAVTKGQGRGGSVRRLEGTSADALTLQAQDIPEDARHAKPAQTSMPLTGKVVGQAAKPKSKSPSDEKLLTYRHDERRVNNPEVGLVTPDDDPDERETRCAYDPHLDPALKFDSGRAQIEKLIDDALASGDAATMRAALEQLKRQAAPYLNWTGKAERRASRSIPFAACARAHGPGDDPDCAAEAHQAQQGRRNRAGRSGRLVRAPGSRTCRCARRWISTSTKRAGRTG